MKLTCVAGPNLVKFSRDYYARIIQFMSCHVLNVRNSIMCRFVGHHHGPRQQQVIIEVQRAVPKTVKLTQFSPLHHNIKKKSNKNVLNVGNA